MRVLTVQLLACHVCCWVQDLTDVEVLAPASISRLKLPDDNEVGLAELELSDGRQLRARLVVGADGGRSRVRQLAGLRRIERRYPHHAVISTVRTSEPSDTAWQRFRPSGPLALLPVTPTYSNIVWSTSPAHAAELAVMSSAEFAEAADHALHEADQESPEPAGTKAALAHHLGRAVFPLMDRVPGPSPEGPPRVLEAPGSRGSFPLTMAVAGTYVRRRMALIGDAAHTVHPLAGQGVNLGFYDAQTLAQVVHEAASCGSDLGDLIHLRDYNRRCHVGNLPMFAALDSIYRIFDNEGGGMVYARASGLKLVNSSSTVKRAVMRYAMGHSSEEVQAMFQSPLSTLLSKATSILR